MPLGTCTTVILLGIVLLVLGIEVLDMEQPVNSIVAMIADALIL